jgi:uncharacterized protein (DUF58 family)
MQVVRTRIRQWFENRLPRSDQWLLTQRNLYILPTPAGWGFGATLLVMLLASINYQLNLGYGLTFLLCGAALVSMHQTHANLRRLSLHIKPPAPGFAGAPATLEIVLDNPGGQRHGIGLGWWAEPDQALAFCDVPAQGSTVVHLRWVPPQRGLQALPTLRVMSHFPMGLFRTWTVWRPAAQLLVYPAPETPAPPLPPGQPQGQSELRARHTRGGGEFDGVRSYRSGDSQRQIVWKKAARTGELVSRDTSTSAAQALVLAHPGTGLTEPEASLSRLCAWVLTAQRLGQPYGLQLPGLNLPVAGAEQQHAAALEALALWNPARAAQPVDTRAARP